MKSWVPLLDRPANYYVVQLNNAKVAVDAGVERSSELASADYVLLTHWHWDHVLGLARTGYIGRVCASETTLRHLQGEPPKFEGAEALRQAFKALPPEAIPLASMSISYTREAIEYIKGGHVELLSLKECEPIVSGLVKPISCPGHTDDHVCYIIDEMAFVGDMINPGGGLSILSLPQYIKSWIALASDTSWTTVMPGHGDSVGRREVLNLVTDEIISKMRRMLRLYSFLNEAPRPLSQYLDLLYPNTSPLIKWVGARSLVGYAVSLAELGLVELNTSSSPWLVRALR